MRRHFRELLEARWAEGKSVCVGLDPDFTKIPEHLKVHAKSNALPGHPEGAVMDSILWFCMAIVDATKDLACAFKPNAAFFEGADTCGQGDSLLRALRSHIHKVAPGVPIIYDAKRADIGNTNNGYVSSALDHLQADAITVHPYLGAEAMDPFLTREDKGVIVLCRTSNPGAGEFQDLQVPNPIAGKDVSKVGEDPGPVFASQTIPLYQHIAYNVAQKWNTRGNCALVVGATYPEELRIVRGIVGDLPLLIPGIGTQGGDVEKTVESGKDSRGRGMIINSSRSILYASSGEDFAEAARRETLKLHEEILKHV